MFCLTLGPKTMELAVMDTSETAKINLSSFQLCQVFCHSDKGWLTHIQVSKLSKVCAIYPKLCLTFKSNTLFLVLFLGTISCFSFSSKCQLLLSQLMTLILFHWEVGKLWQWCHNIAPTHWPTG
jgi:hypothetical protein